MEEKLNLLDGLLSRLGLTEQLLSPVRVLAIISILIVFSLIAFFIARLIIAKVIKRIVDKSENQWDDIILERKVFHRLAHFAPALILYFSATLLLKDYPRLTSIFHNALNIYMTLISMMVLLAFIKALHDIYMQMPIGKERTIKGYVQLANILVIFVSVILIFSYLTGNSPSKLLAGLGAMAAVLLLVFKDTIMGLAASIQLSGNKMLKVGDWITMANKGIDGTVAEITLNTVKVRNFDNTVVTIPTYSLVADAFINWTAMQQSGGRRIIKQIYIDMRSIKMYSPAIDEKLAESELIKPFYHKMLEETGLKANPKTIVTNMGLLRKYLELYYKQDENIIKEFDFMFRSAEASEKGLPLEVYMFTKETSFVPYEMVKSMIIEHIIAVLPEFKLRVFQGATGVDMEYVNK
jgi:miniconductance mechanosensitive channel